MRVVIVRIVVVVAVAQWSTWPWLSSSAFGLIRGGLRSAAHPSAAAIQLWFHLSFFDSFDSCSFSCLLALFASFIVLIFAFFASFIARISGPPKPFFSLELSSCPWPFMIPESDLDFDHRLPSACHPSEWTAESDKDRPGCFGPDGCCVSTCGLQALLSAPVLAAIRLLALVRSNS